jgi:hypothetical protein
LLLALVFIETGAATFKNSLTLQEAASSRTKNALQFATTARFHFSCDGNANRAD